MNRYTKIAAVLGVLVCGLMFVSHSQAFTINMNDWAVGGTQVDDDKVYTLKAKDTAFADASVDFSFDRIGAYDFHKVTVTPASPGLHPGTYQLDYDVQITDPSHVFAAASFGMDVTGVGIFQSKGVKDIVGKAGWNGSIQLVSFGGPVSGVIAGTEISVRLVITVGDDERVSSFSDTYAQMDVTKVPEIDPSCAAGALSFLGMGLAMLLGRRRRGKVA